MIPIIFGFFLTLVTYLLAKPLNKKLPQIPVIVFGMCFVIALLLLLNIPYEQYMAQVNPVFNHLLGYVTVALAIPLAAMRYDDLPLKAVVGILVFASISAVGLPMGLAYLLHLSDPTIMAFATRAVTTPIAINIATLLQAPVSLAILIVILSGVIGAAFSPLILKPWFEFASQAAQTHKVVFGHWAALQGKTISDSIQNVDGGCVWGHQLMAYRLEDETLFAVDNPVQ